VAVKVVILSIKQQYAEAILSGKKTCELRKGRFPKGVRLAIIYASNHEGRITGWFTVKREVVGTPAEIWHQFSNMAGISKEDFDNYYEGADSAVCLVVGEKQRLEKPIDPTEELKGFIPPQSFTYPRKEHLPILTSRIDALYRESLRRYSDPEP
jgi:predicted transcriptional regulator